MIELTYSLVIEATDDPEYYSFYSPDLEGFTGSGNSLEDCLRKAKRGMVEFVQVRQDLKLPVPKRNSQPSILIQNSPKAGAA
jgi:predicted RNase H-like HicB family nuclease